MRSSMKYRLFVFTLALVLVNAFILAPNAAAQNPFKNITVSGVVDGVPFSNGTLTITDFKSDKKGGILAVGLLTIPGTAIVNQVVSIPVDAIFGGLSEPACEVLTLELGPLHLELLGLVVDLNEVVLEITAEPSGGILGQLLCALAGGTDLDNLISFLDDLLDLLEDLFG